MNRDDVIEAIKPLLPELYAMGVMSLALFGSTARNEATEGSDIDVLVTFDETPTFNRFMDVKFLLEDALGQEVDLATPSGLKPQLRPKVEQEAIRVA